MTDSDKKKSGYSATQNQSSLKTKKNKNSRRSLLKIEIFRVGDSSMKILWTEAKMCQVTRHRVYLVRVKSHNPQTAEATSITVHVTEAP